MLVRPMQVDKIDPQSAGRGLLVLFTALLFRMIGVVFAVSGGNLNKKEKIFMAFAWLPKAAVQVEKEYEWKLEILFLLRQQLVRSSLTTRGSSTSRSGNQWDERFSPLRFGQKYDNFPTTFGLHLMLSISNTIHISQPTL